MLSSGCIHPLPRCRRLVYVQIKRNSVGLDPCARASIVRERKSRNAVELYTPVFLPIHIAPGGRINMIIIIIIVGFLHATYSNNVPILGIDGKTAL